MRRLALAAGSILVAECSQKPQWGRRGMGLLRASWEAQGSSFLPYGLNPGNPQNPLPPFVAAACNPG